MGRGKSKRNKKKESCKELIEAAYGNTDTPTEINDTKHSMQKLLNEKIEQNRAFEAFNTPKARTEKVKGRLRAKVAQKLIDEEYKPIKRKW